MLIFVTLIFPPALLMMVLAMERVERPLASRAVGERVADALHVAPAEEVERLVAGLAAETVGRYWHRQQRWSRLAAAYHFGRG